LPRYEARRVLPATVEDVWAVLGEPARWPEWWPGLVRADPSVRRALAPGALWQLEGTERPSFRRRPQLGGTLLILEVVPLRRVVFQMTGERAEVELDLEPVEEGELTAAVLAVDAPRFGGLGRTFPSEALTKLADLVRPAPE
jgi:uncharacterized protein YndB with AHSA1/START domain